MGASGRRRGLALLSGGLAAGMLLAACGGSADSASDSADQATAPGETSVDEPGGGTNAGTDVAQDCAAYVEYLGNEGSTVEILSSTLFAEDQLFDEAWAGFEECTGIDIVHEPTETFEADLSARVSAGDAPDIAWVSGPRELSRLVDAGGPVPAPPGAAGLVDEHWQPVWKRYGSVDGTLYAAPLGAQMNSFVWYSPKMFVENGYEVPGSWDGMWALSDQMVADGMRPWCGGIESGGATGWPAARWLSEVVLRLFGGDVYDRWVAGDLDFASPEISAAMDVLAGWMRNPEYVNGAFGDAASVAFTPVTDVGAGILEGTCGLLQMGDFYSEVWGGFDPSASLGPDGDVYAFHFPQVSSQFPVPVIASGRFVVAFDDASPVQAVQTFLATPEFQGKRAELGNWTTANSGVPPTSYEAGSIQSLAASYLADPRSTLRFDSADLMPMPVGMGEEWTQLTAWFADERSTAEVLSAIDAAWPQQQ